MIANTSFPSVAVGSKRRKTTAPRKLSVSDWDDNGVPFFDELDWQERMTCCGVVQEGVALPGALLIDSSNFRACAEHDKKKLSSTTTDAVEKIIN